METNIKKYGDLTDQEIVELLAEIKDDDEELEDMRLESENNSGLSISAEETENRKIEAFYGDNAWTKPTPGTVALNKPGSPKPRKRRASAINLKERRLKIQRMAFRQTDIDLRSTLGKSDLQQIVNLLVNSYSNRVERYKDFINKRLTILLKPHIPRSLRTCAILYPDSIRHSPGFLYTTGQHYGHLTFWATPDLPFYIEQGYEREIILRAEPSFIRKLDEAVALYHQAVEDRANSEAKFATELVLHRVNTPYALLQHNPIWFELYYNYITKKQN